MTYTVSFAKLPETLEEMKQLAEANLQKPASRSARRRGPNGRIA